MLKTSEMNRNTSMYINYREHRRNLANKKREEFYKRIEQLEKERLERIEKLRPYRDIIWIPGLIVTYIPILAITSIFGLIPMMSLCLSAAFFAMLIIGANPGDTEDGPWMFFTWLFMPFRIWKSYRDTGSFEKQS